jgi:phosphopantothenoylcysteine decarboxylase/phosphopantothenate--cysteine ligase
MHPAEDIRGSLSTKLSQKRIVLGVTGSIAAVESVRLIRELIRHGAEVIPVMTPEARHILHPYALEFAASHTPILELTGQTEHVSYCGLIQDPVDLLLISPCTANTLSKIAHGIDDTPVTTFATTAIGSKIPMVIVPAMHRSMYQHIEIQNNIQRCQRLGISFLQPTLKGNKAKLPPIEEIVAYVIRQLGSQHLAKKRVLIIGGATAQPVDDIRILTNRSSGKTAIAYALAAYEQGAEVELWYGHATEPIPSYLLSKRFETIEELEKLITKNIRNYDVIIVCAAIADYTPIRYNGKIPSGKPTLHIKLQPTSKILEKIKTLTPKSYLIAHKLEEKKSTLKKAAMSLQKKYNLAMVVANTTAACEKEENDILLLTKKGKSFQRKGNKQELAHYVLEKIG